MNVASNLLCLEQVVAGARGASVAAFFGPLGELRDALYELYCDCGDPRMSAVYGAGRPLSTYVSGLYALCNEILENLSLVYGMRSGHPDLVPIAAEIGTRCAAFVQATSELPDLAAEALASVTVDATNAVDPLRDASRHFQDVVRAAGDVLRTKLG
jgi:hypothetical protein